MKILINHQTRLNQFIDDYHVLNKAFVWDLQLIKQFGALVLSKPHTRLDAEEIKEMRSYIKHQTSSFSYFRGMNELMLAILVQNQPNSHGVFDLTTQYYDKLKAAGFKSGPYLPMAALSLASYLGEQTIESLISRMSDFYHGMKANHFWLTGQDDYVFAALLAQSGLPVDASLKHMEMFYGDLADAGFYKGNPLQSLTHVLTLGEESYTTKLERTVRLNQYLIKKGYKLSSYHMPIMGVLVLISDTPEELVDQAIDIERALTREKGFGGFSMEKKTRFVLSAMLIAQSVVENQVNQESSLSAAVLANSIQSIIIAQQVAMTAIIVAASSSAATSS